MKELRYECTVLSAQLGSALALLIFLKGRAGLFMYLVLAAPVLFLFCAFLLRKKIALYKTAALFWLVFAGSVFGFWFYSPAAAWFSVDGYSVTALIYFILNTVFCIAAPHTEINGVFGVRTPFSMQSPAIWKQVHAVFGVALSFSILPLFLLIFWVPGMLKFVLCNVLFLGTVLVGAALGLHAAARHKQEERAAKR